MKTLLIAGAMALSLTCSAQLPYARGGANPDQSDTVMLDHKTYVSVFIKSAHIPYFVEYNLGGSDLACSNHIPRTNRFLSDPLLPEATNLKKDYAASGYDQGHNMSAEDNACDTQAMVECFYFSNMFPQTPKLNRGVWKALENIERSYANNEGMIRVMIGSYGVSKKLGPDSVIVPQYCWKVIYHYKTKSYEAYTFPNDDSPTGSPADYKTTVGEITALTGVQFSN